MVVDRLYAYRDRKLRRHGHDAAAALGRLCATPTALFYAAHRRVHVRVALYDKGHAMMKKEATAKASNDEPSAAQSLDAVIKQHGDWRGRTLAKIRALIKGADPDVIEDVKWRKPSNNMLGVPVWEHDGLIC